MPAPKKKLNPNDANSTETVYDGPSKSQLKRDADAQQTLGKALTELSNEKLNKLNLPEELYAAVREFKRLSANGAIRRQLQYIGRLMRDIDTAPIAEQLQKWEGKNLEENARFHGLERWRMRLLSQPQALAAFLAEYPQANSQQLHTLIRNAQKEEAANKPPKSSRALFQLIREISEAATTPNLTVLKSQNPDQSLGQNLGQNLGQDSEGADSQNPDLDDLEDQE